jgi:hypothetical protein
MMRGKGQAIRCGWRVQTYTEEERNRVREAGQTDSEEERNQMRKERANWWGKRQTDDEEEGNYRCWGRRPLDDEEKGQKGLAIRCGGSEAIESGKQGKQFERKRATRC